MAKLCAELPNQTAGLHVLMCWVRKGRKARTAADRREGVAAVVEKLPERAAALRLARLRARAARGCACAWGVCRES